MVSRHQQATASFASVASKRGPPGIEDPVELDDECAVTMEIRSSAQSSARPRTSLNSEEEDASGPEVGGT